MTRLATASSTLSIVVFAGCGTAGGTTAVTTEMAPDAVINGRTTDDLPAIGVMDSGFGTLCTATLIASRVVLTAAHCFNFDDTRSGLGSDASPSTYGIQWHGSFTVRNAKRSPDAFMTAIGRFAVLSKQLGSSDVAVAELRDDVPSDYATPLTVHVGSHPADGETLHIYGFGCTSKTWDTGKRAWIEGPGFGTKRVVDAPFDRAAFTVPGNTTCPGDSGGPAIDFEGDIVGVVSGSHDTFSTSSGSLKSTVDMLADAWERAGWIQELAVLYERLPPGRLSPT